MILQRFKTMWGFEEAFETACWEINCWMGDTERQHFERYAAKEAA
jgi:hypothetical protein